MRLPTLTQFIIATIIAYSTGCQNVRALHQTDGPDSDYITNTQCMALVSYHKRQMTERDINSAAYICYNQPFTSRREYILKNVTDAQLADLGSLVGHQINLGSFSNAELANLGDMAAKQMRHETCPFRQHPLLWLFMSTPALWAALYLRRRKRSG